MENEESWKPIGGFETKYEVSNTGRVRRINYLKPDLAKGYERVELYDGDKLRIEKVHRLVMEAFSGDCPTGKEVNHKDGNKRNNRADNLEYVTHKENLAHAVKTGLHRGPINPWRGVGARGESCGMAKLKWEQVREIRKRVANGESMRSLAKVFGVGSSTVGLIVHNRTWIENTL